MKPPQASIRIAKLCSLALLLGYCSTERVVAQTGTFLDRRLPTDIRLLDYNVLENRIFTSVDPLQAEKFVRLVRAVNPDILTLQEVNSPAASTKALLDSIVPLGGAGWYTHKARGTVIASRYPLSMLHTSIDPSSDRPPSIALVDLPNAQYVSDFYVVNHHFQPGTAIPGPEKRQKAADSTVQWINDAKTPGGFVNLPPGTPIAVVGDFNTPDIQSMLDGDVVYEDLYGPDSPPDWDGTSFVNANPTVNALGAETYTMRFGPSKLKIDHVTYSDSALDVAHKFVLNTVEMSSADLAATGLQRLDVTMDQGDVNYDHLPLVVDFRVFNFASSDFNFSRSVGSDDLAIWKAGVNSSGSTRAQGDANGDGRVDGQDFLIWQRQFNGAPSAASPAGGTVAVPEPGSLALIAFVGTLGLLSRRRRGRRLDFSCQD